MPVVALRWWYGGDGAAERKWAEPLLPRAKASGGGSRMELASP